MKIVEGKIKEDESNRFRHKRVFNLQVMPYDFPIYRVFKAKHLYDMIINKRNTLVHISQWDDPFEGFILKQDAWDCERKIPVSLKSLFVDYYGQCWSLNGEETDATWRVYSPDKNRILVKSSFRKLWNGFYGNDKFKHDGSDYSMTVCAIGRVEYWEEDDIVDEFESTLFRERLDSEGAGLIKTLLIKRKEFKYEKEIRIIFNDDKGTLNLGDGKTMSYPVNTHKLDPYNIIDGLIADPRMPDICFKGLEKDLGEEGFKIEKSKLYQLRELKLRY